MNRDTNTCSSEIFASSFRYDRQARLREIGDNGQDVIRKAKILIVGVGGLGSPAALYLAAAGVGTLGLVDDDRVSISNLQRQILFSTPQVDSSKIASAVGRLRDLNPEVRIQAHELALSASNALAIMAGYDLVLDGTDNFSAKFLINDAAAKLGIPVVYGSISRFEGQVAIFNARVSACYRCVYPEAPKIPISNCAEAGVLGAVAGIVGSIQALQAIEWLLESKNPGRFETLEGNLLVCDLSRMEFRRMSLRKRASCKTCGVSPHQIELGDLPGTAELDWSSTLDLVNSQQALLIDVRETEEWADGHVENAIHWPLSLLRKGELPQLCLAEGSELLLYCWSGVRSREAAAILQPLLPARVRSVQGGIEALSLRSGSLRSNLRSQSAAG